MRLFIIRHADPDYANDSLTAPGHLEAAALAERMRRIGLDRIYTSPLGRALATMKYTADALDLPHTVETWTAEIGDATIDLPPWGRLSVWDVPGEVIRADAPYVNAETWHEHAAFAEPALKSRYARMVSDSDAFIARHGYERVGGRYRLVQPNREKIGVFCHGGFGLWWLAHLLELPLPLACSGFYLPPSSVTTVLFDERSETWAVPRCLAVGDTSHLYAAGLDVQRAGIKANTD